MDALIRAQVASLADTRVVLLGNGGLEVDAWVVIAAATPGARGETIFYDAMSRWATGMAGAEMQPSRQDARRPKSRPDHSTLVFIRNLI